VPQLLFVAFDYFIPTFPSGKRLSIDRALLLWGANAPVPLVSHPFLVYPTTTKQVLVYYSFSRLLLFSVSLY